MAQSTISSGTIERPGVSIYYEVRGTGAPLLLLPAAYGTVLADEDYAFGLSLRYTLITFDRRGSLRSPIRGLEREDITMNLVQDTVEDIAAVLRKTSPTQPVFAYTSSIGCMYGIEMLARHPEMIRRLVIHDPVIPTLLVGPSFDEVFSGMKTVVALYRSTGAAAASKHLFQLILDENERELIRASPDHSKALALAIICFDFLFDCELDVLLAYRAPIDLLKQHKGKLSLLVGVLSTTPATVEPVRALGELLGLSVNGVPGGHIGSDTHREGFICDLVKILEGDPQRYKSRL